LRPYYRLALSMSKLHAAFYALICVTIALFPSPVTSAPPVPTPAPTAGVARFVGAETKASVCRNDVCHNDGGSVAVVTGAQLLAFMLTKDAATSTSIPRVDADTDAVLDLFDVSTPDAIRKTSGAEMLSYFLANSEPKITGSEMLSYFMSRQIPSTVTISCDDAGTDAVLDLFGTVSGTQELAYLLAQEQAPVTGSEMLSYFLAQEQAPVTGSEMLSYFLAQEDLTLSGTQELAYLLAKEEEPVTGSEMLSYFLAQDATPPTTGSELLRYLLKQEAVRTITGVEMLNFMLNDPDFLAPTATPTLAPRHASGRQILEYFTAYSDYEEIWSDASAERGKPLIDYLLRNRDTPISGEQIVEVLTHFESISDRQRRRLQSIVTNGDFAVTGQVVLDYLTTVEGMAVKGTSIEGGVSVGDDAPPQVMAAPLKELYEVWSKDRQLISNCLLHSAGCPGQLTKLIERARNEAVLDDAVESICANSAAAELAVCNSRGSFALAARSMMSI